MVTPPPDEVMRILLHPSNARRNADLKARMGELVLGKQAEVLEQQGAGSDKRLDPPASDLVPLVVPDGINDVFRVRDDRPDPQAGIELGAPMTEPLFLFKERIANEGIQGEVVHAVRDLKLLNNGVHSRRGINHCSAPSPHQALVLGSVGKHPEVKELDRCPKPGIAFEVVPRSQPVPGRGFKRLVVERDILKCVVISGRRLFDGDVTAVCKAFSGVEV